MDRMYRSFPYIIGKEKTQKTCTAQLPQFDGGFFGSAGKNAVHLFYFRVH